MIVLMIDGYNTSTGVSEEIALAIDNNIPIIFVNPIDLLGPNFAINNDGVILFKVSKIRSSIARRMAIAATFVPMMVLTSILVAISATATLWRSIGSVSKTAVKHW